jgi:hypothetical protein
MTTKPGRDAADMTFTILNLPSTFVVEPSPWQR